MSIKTLRKIVDFTGCSTDYILFGNENNNSLNAKINRILSRCSDETLEYFYSILRSTFGFLKKSGRENIGYTV